MAPEGGGDRARTKVTLLGKLVREQPVFFLQCRQGFRYERLLMFGVSHTHGSGTSKSQTP
jgi:hypothetical protein